MNSIRYAIKVGKLPEGHIVFEGIKARTVDRKARIVEIVDEAGRITVRGIAYRLLGEGLISNMKGGYTLVSALTVEMRENDELDPDKVIDDTTDYGGWWGYGSFDDYLATFEDAYLHDVWQDQDERIEVWVEKGTVAGVLEAVFEEHRVASLPVHGNLHFGAAHKIAAQIVRRGQRVKVLYLGDFDPSGLNICDVNGRGVIRGRMSERLDKWDRGGLFTIERIALTEEDVEHPDIEPLSVPVKEHVRDEDGAIIRRGDPNAPDYVAEYGERCWEVDAMPVATLKDRVASEIVARRDPVRWQASLDREAEDQAWVKRRVQRMRQDRKPA